MSQAQEPLHFPVPTAPAPGSLTEIAPGVLWLRLALPYVLDHVNVYLLEDGAGWAVIDTGLGDEMTKAAWDAVLTGPLAGRPLTRLIVTHFHPDHIGLAGWLTERFGLPLYMSQTEYLFSLNLQLDGHGFTEASQRRFYTRAGLEPEALEQVIGRGHHYLKMVTGLPQSYRRLMQNDRLEIGGRSFEIHTGGGHSPEQVMLFQGSDKLFFSADQVLAKISPNVSIWSTEPEGDPLGLYLRSLDRLKASLPEDVLVLACHNLPFQGLHARIDGLKAHHAQRCQSILDACRPAPKTAAELLPVLFRRTLDAHQTGFAFGEALAHVNRLVIEGTLVREDGPDGVQHYRTR